MTVLEKPGRTYDPAQEARRNNELEESLRRKWDHRGDVDHPHRLQIRGQFLVSDSDAFLDYILARIGGNFTSGGGFDRCYGLVVNPAITAAAGDTVIISGASHSAQITTQGASETITDVSTWRIFEPQITVGTGDTITNAATVIIENAPTEGTNNYALWVEAGAVGIDGPLVHARTAFADQDATPDVSAGTYFVTANTIATTITDFDGGVQGQQIIVEIGDTNTTIDFTASGLRGNVGADWSPTTNDHMTCVYNGTDWLCTVSDNTA